jgi:hypothetical protein
VIVLIQLVLTSSVISVSTVVSLPCVSHDCFDPVGFDKSMISVSTVVSLPCVSHDY